MKMSRRNVQPVRSLSARFCVVEPLELRKILSTTFPNILPIGDSITESETGHASYRYWLWNSLADAGHIVDFVGSHVPPGVANGPPLFPGFDPHHDGYSGWRADDMLAGLNSQPWKDFATQPRNTPDIALVHIGTNDVLQGQSNAITRNEISGIIDALRAVNPNVTVLLAQIIPNATASVEPLNVMLSALATLKNTAASPVILVDQATGFDPATDTYDGTHPNESGEKKIAGNWLAALAPLLPAPTAPPEGVYLDTPAVPLTNSINGLGPVEYEASNGLDGTHDGQLLSIRGQTFMRGFGVHAPAELTFDLSGATYTRFRATVGVDDEVNPNGSVVFQVFVNNEAAPRFSSQVLTGTDAPLAVDVEISGATSLRLVATDGGNGVEFDHADWAQARLIAAESEPPPPEPPPPEGEVEAPSKPRKLVAKYHSNAVELRWKDKSNNESGFHVQRRDRGTGTWEQIAELPAGTAAFTDTDIAPGGRYQYRVFAFNDAGPSSASNVANANVPQAKKAKKDKPRKDDHRNDDKKDDRKNEDRDKDDDKEEAGRSEQERNDRKKKVQRVKESVLKALERVIEAIKEWRGR